jgi:hypothetical protein
MCDLSLSSCCKIYDPQEEIWRAWIEESLSSSCPYQADLYIHAKYPERIQSQWVRSRTLSHSYRPEWNSPEVIRAMLAVLEKALANDQNGRFVFGTGHQLTLLSSPHLSLRILYSNLQSPRNW